MEICIKKEEKIMSSLSLYDLNNNKATKDGICLWQLTIFWNI
jgi:hypothetical protein